MGARQDWNTRSAALLAALSILLAGSLAAAAHYGVSAHSWSDAWSSDEAREVVLGLRLPRALFGAIVGGTLAVIGAAYQALFRNPLASPFSLGVSSGAALGASFAIFLGSRAGFGAETGSVLAAALSILIIVLLSRARGLQSQDSLLLVGIVFSFFCSSVLTLLQYMSDYAQLFRATRWMLGGVPVVSWGTVVVGALLAVATTAWLWGNHRALDLMLFGDDFAYVKGISPRSFSRLTFIVTSIAVGWLVAQCGVIGFVGIIVPASVRLIVGLHHTRVIPVSFLMGAVLVVSCDLAGRLVTPPFEVPAGVFTAVLGGPLFVFLLLRSNREIL